MQLYKNAKHKITVALSLFLAVIMTAGLVGCGNGKDKDTKSGTKETKTTMGRYLEEDIPLPEDFIAIETMKILDDDSLAVFYTDQNNLFHFTKSSDKGQTWEKASLLAELMDLPYDKENGDYIIRSAIAKDGSLFVGTFTAEKDSDDFQMAYYYRSSDGKTKTLDIADTINSPIISDSQFGDNGNLFFNAVGNGVLEINPSDGTLVHSYEKGSSVDFMGMSGKNLVLVTEGTVHYYDIETGKPLDTGEPLTQQITSKESNLQNVSSSSVPILFLSGDKEDSIFYLDHSGMYRYSFDGSVMEQLIDGSLNSIGSPSTGFTSAVRDEDSFYISSSDYSSGDLKGKIYHYTYSKDTPTVPDTELKIYSLKDNSFIRQAAAIFQKKYPDVYLNLEIGMSGDDAVTTTDALKTLNTEIMAGKGPDIMILDGIPQDTYIQKGMLEDLSGILKEAGLLENIQNAYTKKDGSIYTMPVKFGIPMIVGHTKDIAAITDLKSMADVIENHKEEYGLNKTLAYTLPLSTSLSTKMLLENLEDSCSAAWLKDDGTLDEALIKDFLEQANRIYQTSTKGLQEIGKQYGEDFVNQVSEYDRTLSMAYAAKQVMNHTFILSAGAIYSPTDIAEIDSVQNLDSSVTKKVWNAQAKNCFVPVNIVGISSKSSEKEAAKKFISFLFSDDGQQITKFDGFPVTKNLYDKDAYWDQGEPGTVIHSSSSYNAKTGIEDYFETKTPTKEVVRSFLDLGKTLTTPIADNEIILSAVTDAGIRYLNGEISLDEATNNIIQEVNLYLSE